jgi:hypothetical protein
LIYAFQICCVISTGNTYYTMVVVRSPNRRYNIRLPFPGVNAKVCVLKQSAFALEAIGSSTFYILQYIDEILDITDDKVLDAREHDKLLFDDDSFSRSRKYWWASNLLVVLQQKIEESLKVHRKVVDNLFKPDIGLTTDSKVSSKWREGLKGIDERAIETYEFLEKLLVKIEAQKKSVDTLRGAVSSYPRFSFYLRMFLTFTTALQC